MAGKLRMEGRQEESLVVPPQQGHPLQLPATLSYVPFCIHESSARGPCSTWCLAPNWEGRKDAEEIGEGKGGYTGVSSGVCAKEIGDTAGEPIRSTGGGSQVIAVGS